MTIVCDRCHEEFQAEFFWHCHIAFHWAIEALKNKEDEVRRQ